MSDRLDPASDPDTHATATNLSSSFGEEKQRSNFPPANRAKWNPPPTHPPSHTGIYSFFSIPVIPASLSEIYVIVSVEYPRENVGVIVAKTRQKYISNFLP
jgi:hypothetical protein